MSAGGGGDRPVRVLLVDDSETSRHALRRILTDACGAEVVATAADGEEALQLAVAFRPDLVLLDLEMPRMDGLTFLRLLGDRRPTPVVVISAHSRPSRVAKALALGALDFVAKPGPGVPLEALGAALAEKCRVARTLRSARPAEPPPAPGDERPRAAAELAAFSGVLALGASTGGTGAIRSVLGQLPGALPVAVVVAQHLPARSTAAFAERLSRTTPFSVQEAQGGELLAPGRVLVAPGGRDLEVVRAADGALRAAVLPARSPRGGCPSVDRLFESVAREAGRAACAVVLTGMGRDGGAGAARVRAAGGLTIAESEETAVVYGMPRAAVEAGAVDELLPLHAIAARVARRFGEG